jgi:Flp pilus assembly protein TadD
MMGLIARISRYSPARLTVGNIAAMVLLLSLGACSSAPSGSAGPGVMAATPVKDANPAYLAAGEATLHSGRFAEAMQIYQEVLVADPKSVAAQYGVAESLLGQGKAGDARPIFEVLATNAEFQARALQGEGLALLTLGQREPAAKLFRQATDADPTLWRSWNGLAVLADLRREPVEAAIAYARALAIDPTSAVLHNNFGYSYLLAGKSDDAMTEFRKAYSLDPASETIQSNIRLALAAEGNYAAAIRDVPKGRLPAVLNNIGYVAMQRGDLAAAEGYFARAMESSTSFNTIASQNIEQLKTKQGEAP